MDECPLNAECALELVNGMKKAQGDIEKLTERQEEIIKKIDDIHKIFIMLSGFKRGIITAFVFFFRGLSFLYRENISQRFNQLVAVKSSGQDSIRAI